MNNWGDSIWYRDYTYYYAQESHNRLNDIYPTSDNGFILGGGAVLFELFGDQEKIWVAKIDSSGCLEAGCDPTIGFEPPHILSPSFYIYPNPGTDRLLMNLSFQHKGGIFKLFDIGGKLVHSAVISRQYFELNTSSLNPGTYIYTILNENGVRESGKWIKR